MRQRRKRPALQHGRTHLSLSNSDKDLVIVEGGPALCTEVAAAPNSTVVEFFDLADTQQEVFTTTISRYGSKVEFCTRLKESASEIAGRMHDNQQAARDDMRLLCGEILRAFDWNNDQSAVADDDSDDDDYTELHHGDLLLVKYGEGGDAVYWVACIINVEVAIQEHDQDVQDLYSLTRDSDDDEVREEFTLNLGTQLLVAFPGVWRDGFCVISHDDVEFNMAQAADLLWGSHLSVSDEKVHDFTLNVIDMWQLQDSTAEKAHAIALAALGYSDNGSGDSDSDSTYDP
eukprot:9014-Heterococcus_DN1.PRE.2